MTTTQLAAGRRRRFGRIRDAIAKIRAATRPSSDREFVFLLGVAGLAIGFGLIWLPLGVIIPSTILVVVAVMSPPEPPESREA